MLERAEPVLKILCLALAALMLLQCARAALRTDPLKRIHVSAMSAVLGQPAPQARPATAKATNSVPPVSSPKRTADLPPSVQARIDRIKESEIFGAAPRPMVLPVALLGIAGEYAMLRGPSGQTDLIKVGEQLGGMKLLQIGTNRVVVEQDGQKKELTIFLGLGSDTLLPK